MGLHMSSPEIRPIKVGLFGMDERSISRMETVFKIIFKGRCESTDYNQPDNSPDIGILDIDGWNNDNHNTSAWDDYRRLNPLLPTIILSDKEVLIDNIICLTKPAKLDLLWAAIEQCLTGIPVLASTTCNTIQTTATVTKIASARPSTEEILTCEPQEKLYRKSNTAYAMEAKYETPRSGPQVVNKSYTDVSEAIFFDPNEYLLGILQKHLDDIADKPGISLLVHCWKNRTVIIFPSKGLAYSELNDAQLKNLGIAKLSEGTDIHIEEIDSDYANALVVKNNPKAHFLTINAFLWDITLRTSRGRIPKGSSVSNPIYLSNWPNLTRLSHTPHAMRISAFLIDNPCSLEDISSKLNIDKKHVYSFFSAASSIGLAGAAKRKSDTILEPKPANYNPEKRGLLSSILRRISKA
jgi:hypothetical protein